MSRAAVVRLSRLHSLRPPQRPAGRTRENVEVAQEPCGGACAFTMLNVADATRLGALLHFACSWRGRLG